MLTIGPEKYSLLDDTVGAGATGNELKLGTDGALMEDVLAQRNPLLVDPYGGGAPTDDVLKEVGVMLPETGTLLIEAPGPDELTESVLVEAGAELVGAPMTLAAKSTPELTPMPVMLFFR